MIISKIYTSSTNQNFTGTNTVYYNASQAYKKLGQDFLEQTQQQGINKGTIVELLKRMILSPKFEQLSLDSIYKELLEKIRPILEAVNGGKSSEELQKLFKLPEQTVSGLLIKQAVLKRAQEVTKLYREGMKIQDIAKLKNIAESTVRKYLNDCGISFAYPPIPTEKLTELVKNGYSDIQIAEELGVHKNSVERARKKLNLKSNRQKGKVQAVHEEIVKDLESGQKRRDIAKKYGICKERVDKIAEEIGAYRNNVAKRNAKAIELFEQGLPPKAVAAELGVSHATVLRIAHSHNFPLLKDYTERNKAILEALKTKSIVDVAKEFNLSQQRIWTIKETFKG